MFHELGHAVLGRQHTNELLPDCSSYKSMMMDGDQFVVYASEDDIKRTYYIDELFDPRTSYPSWGGTAKTNKTSVFNNVTTGWEFFTVGGSTQTGSIEADNSFLIHSEVKGTGQGLWKLTLPSQQFPSGSTLTVTGQLKFSNVTKSALGVILQPDIEKNKYFWVSTNQYFNRITGSSEDWLPFKLTLNCYPSDKPEMFVYLYFLGDSTGDVWFKDISVDYYN